MVSLTRKVNTDFFSFLVLIVFLNKSFPGTLYLHETEHIFTYVKYLIFIFY